MLSAAVPLTPANGIVVQPDTEFTASPGVRVPPVATITSPALDASYEEGASVALAGTLIDANGVVLVGSWSSDIGGPLGLGNLTLDDLPVGTHVLTFGGADSQDDEHYVTRELTITAAEGANTPPTVTIDAPTNGQALTAGEPFTFRATATDPDGVVEAVTFSVNSGEPVLATQVDDTDEWELELTLPAAGSHSVVATATDDDDATTATAARSFTTAEESEGPTILFDTAFDEPEQVVGERAVGWSVPWQDYFDPTIAELSPYGNVVQRIVPTLNRNVAKCDAAAVANVADGEVLMIFQLEHTRATGFNGPGIAVRGTGTGTASAGQACYALCVGMAGSPSVKKLQLLAYKNAAGAVTVLQQVDSTWPSNALAVQRIRFQGGALLGKVWAYGDSEPTDWQITAEDTYRANGWVGMIQIINSANIVLGGTDALTYGTRIMRFIVSSGAGTIPVPVL